MILIENPLDSKKGFADLYLERYGSESGSHLPLPDPDLYLIVTIPSFKEPNLADSIRSLLACDPPGVKWEILININYPEGSDRDVIDMSRKSLSTIEQISASLNRDDVRIMGLWNPDMPKRHAGVGLARKLAMDEAVRRFNAVGHPDGVILAFDADSTCQANYLKTVAEFYLHHSGARTANIYFEHPLTGTMDAGIYHAIAQYELYLRYMRLATEQTGHPHGMHTVGSSFTVRCKTYIRVTGMGRDKAGEDFYFLHKCARLKGFWEINETAIYPSARESDRVSFGTGASIRQLQTASELYVYDFDCFKALKDLFQRANHFWNLLNTHGDLKKELDTLPVSLSGFLLAQNAVKRIQDMYHDTAGEQTFVDKFFAWFNGFLILRYLNEAHKDYYVKKPIMTEASILAEILDIPVAETVEGLLINYRNVERSKGNRRII